MKLLITGGAGFIGSAVIRYIVSNSQDQVVNLDKRTCAVNGENLAEVIDNERYASEQIGIGDRMNVAYGLNTSRVEEKAGYEPQTDTWKRVSGFLECYKERMRIADAVEDR